MLLWFLKLEEKNCLRVLHESQNNKKTVFEIKAALLFNWITFQNFLMTYDFLLDY